MNLRNLINQLPFYFKEADTYKNSNGEGLLERYLQIFGKYLEDDLKPSIESMREYISVDVFSENDNSNGYTEIVQSLRGIFTSDYFCDFLGQMPYARLLKEPIRDIEAKSLDLASGSTYKPIFKSFTKYDLGPIKLTLADISYLFSIIDRTPGTVEGSLIDTTNVNSSFFALLVYSVPLYKIRGTEKFFRIYFEMLDLGIYVSSISDSTTIYHKDTLNDKSEVQVNGSDTEFYTKEVSDVKGLNDVITKLDQKDNLLDGCNLDAHPSCQKCKTVNVVMDDSKISANTPDQFWALHSKVLSIFDRFLPINVKANITYSDKRNDWNKVYLITNPIINFYIWDGKDWIISSNSNEWVKNNYIDINRKEVKVKVIITDTTIRGSHTKYHFEVLDNGSYTTTNKSETIHDSGDIITITKSGTYYIRVCENKLNFGSGFPEIPVINSFTIRKTSLVINPSITYKIVDSNGSEVEGGFSIPSKGGNTSYLYIRVYSYVNNEWANFTIENPDGTVENIMDYESSDDEGRYYYDYYIESKGTYKISLISYPTIYTKVEVGMEDEYADCNLRYISSTLLKEGDSIPVAIRATISYLAKLNKIGLCSSTSSNSYVSLHSSKYLDSLYADVDSNSSIYGITSKASIVGLSHNGYIHCYLKLDTSAWNVTEENKYIQLKNVPYDDKNSFIGIYNPSTKALTKLPIKWRKLRKVTTPYGTYNVKDSVPYGISGYLRNNNTNLLEILSTGVGWAVNYENPNKYYMDGDIVYLDRVGDYEYSGAIPQLDERNEYYETGGDYIEIDQDIVDIGPLNYILSPHGTFFYPTQESTGLPADNDMIKFTLTCVTNLSWSTGRAYKKKNLIPITGIIQQYKFNPIKGLVWSTVLNPNIFTEEDTSFSTYTLKYEYTLSYGNYNTYPTRIKLGGLTEHYIDVHLGIFIDPNKNYIYLQPVDPLDGGWSKPNWGSADLSTPSNTPDRVEYDLMANKLEFTIQQTLIDNNNKSGGVNGGMAKLFTVTTQDGKEVETYTGQSYIIGTEVISNIKTTGKYRLRGEGDYSANYIEINVISSGTFKIACDPPVAALSAEGYATTRVTATCDTPNTPAYQLQVQRDGESVWHDVPYDFVANNLGVYHFIVRGNTTVGTTFSVVSKLTVSTNKSQLTWAADNTDIQEVKLTADNNLQWSIEVSDD